MKFYVVRELSKKSGKEFIALVVDLGYRKVPVVFDYPSIAEISGLSYQELYAMKLHDTIYVGDYVSAKVVTK